MDQDETWRGGRPRSSPHCVRWGPSSTAIKGHSPQFSAHVCCSQMDRSIKMTLGTEVAWPRSWPHCVRWGHTPTPSKGHSPQFSAHVCCGQTARWIKMPVGTEVGLGPGDIVLDGDPAPPIKGHSLRTLRPMSIVAKRLERSKCHLVRR